MPGYVGYLSGAVLLFGQVSDDLLFAVRQVIVARTLANLRR
jgi:hypothetical protein